MPLTYYSKFSMFTLRIWVFKSELYIYWIYEVKASRISKIITDGYWQVFHIVGLCVFSHQSADYSIVVAHLTIDYSKNVVPLKRCAHTSESIMFNIDKSCTCTMPLTYYSKFSMFTLRIWVFKSGVFKNLFILSKHGMKANIRSTKMANNRHAYNRDVIQSNWTSDGLPLYCSQPTGRHNGHTCVSTSF
jgi:hypothetical protein